MDTVAFLLKGSRDHIDQVQQGLRALLPAQLDVGLTPLTPSRSMLPVHIVHALQLAQPGLPPARFFELRGVAVQPLDENEAQARLVARVPEELPTRAVARRRRVGGYDWHLQMCRVPQAWSRLGGVSNIQWKVRVGQLDTGYTKHPAFGFGGSTTPWVSVDESRTFFSRSAGDVFPVDPSPEGMDDMMGTSAGHGTRIGSAICGFDPKVSFYGVAPRVPLVMARVTDNVIVGHRQLEMIDGIRHLVQTARVDVINVSLGFLPPGVTLEAFKQVISEAYEAGVIIVCAAGNDVAPVVVPARLNRTIAMAGVTSEEVPWHRSSYGPSVDLSAPAAGIYGASVSQGFGGLNFVYGGGGNGTSYAAAACSGAAALWLQYRGDELAQAYSEPWQRAAAFRHLVRGTARVPDVSINGTQLWQEGSFGKGVLNVDALLQADLPPADALASQKDAQP